MIYVCFRSHSSSIHNNIGTKIGNILCVFNLISSIFSKKCVLKYQTPCSISPHNMIPIYTVIQTKLWNLFLQKDANLLFSPYLNHFYLFCLVEGPITQSNQLISFFLQSKYPNATFQEGSQKINANQVSNIPPYSTWTTENINQRSACSALDKELAFASQRSQYESAASRLK